MCCDPYYMERPQELIPKLAEAMEMLWSIDVSDCPRHRTIDAELEEARYRVENRLVDLENAEPSTFGAGGFRAPEDLLHWLEHNRPTYEPVLSHGDFCLPNLFTDGERFTGFIDVGRVGAGDRWMDLALGWRSLKHNSDGHYGSYPSIDPDDLFRAAGIPKDPERLRYYLLLDELF